MKSKKSAQEVSKFTAKISYCVLWMPTMFHQHPILICGNLKPIPINDGMNSLTYLKLILEEPTSSRYPHRRSISITAYKEGSMKSDERWTLRLKCVDTSRNGMMKYSYTLGSKDNSRNLLIDSDGYITHAVYAAIKSLYHKHLYHKSDDDSILNPYCIPNFQDGNTPHIPTDVDIHSDENSALLHYLSCYEENFMVKVKDFQESQDDLKIAFKYQKQKEQRMALDRFVAIAEDILEKSQNALGEVLFLNALSLSKYNHSFKTSCCPTREKEGNTSIKTEKEKRQKAINIENSITYIRTLKIYTRNVFNSVLAKLTQQQQGELNTAIDRVKDIQTKETEAAKKRGADANIADKRNFALAMLSIGLGVSSVLIAKEQKLTDLGVFWLAFYDIVVVCVLFIFIKCSKK